MSLAARAFAAHRKDVPAADFIANASRRHAPAQAFREARTAYYCHHEPAYRAWYPQGACCVSEVSRR